MTDTYNISRDDLIQQIKLSCHVPSIVKDAISRQLIVRRASEKHIEVEAVELQKAADDLRLKKGLQNAEETWAWLQKYNLSLEEFEELVRTTVLSSKLAWYLFANRVEAYYIEHQFEYTQVVMYEIPLDDEDLALEIFYAIQENEMDFSEAADRYIRDPELRRAKGYRGVLKRSQIQSEISVAVFSASPPQLLKPIVTHSAVHLIFVEEIVQPKLDDALNQKIISELFSAWLQQQTSQAKIVINLDVEK
jgi:parvulin-like peptidyl-prolyl isomerase